MSRPVAAFSVLVAAMLALFPPTASAQEGLLEGFKAIFDANLFTSSTKTTDASGQVAKTATDGFLPRLTITADTLVFPNTRLAIGGMFDVNLLSSTFGDTDSNSTLTRLRPYFELRSTNPTLSPGIGYYRRENRARTDGTDRPTLISEDYVAYLGWNPEGLPQSYLQLVRTNTFDGERAFQDITKDFGSVSSRFRYNTVDLSYQGSYLDTEDRVRSFETRQWTNAARVDHSGSYLSKRLQWNTSYNINHQSLETIASGDGGEVSIPVIPFAGLALVTDATLTASLSPAPSLVDADLTASSGIDLGVAEPGPDAQARNIGLDFLTPAEANRLLVWVDRDLPAEIARAFSWEIYTSEDNVTWRRHSLVSTAPFGPFENRFQVDFGNVTTRYLKVVTRPLSATLPDASGFPDILVTEMQAFLVRPAGDAPRLARTAHVFSTDARMRILDVPFLYYEGSYWLSGASPGSYTDTLSNGVSVSHRFSPMVAVYGRGALEQGHQPAGYRLALVQNASLTFDPIPTLRSSLLYTGLNERVDDLPNDRQGVVVQTDAQLYRGVDLLVGFGWNFTERDTGEELRDRLFNVSAIVVPQPNVHVTFSYADTTTTRSGAVSGSPSYRTRRGYLTLAIDPLRTLHLVVGEEVSAVTGERTRLTHNISANWTPFQDGSLQFLVAYNEALRDPEFGSERNFSQSVRWTFAGQSYLQLSYQRIEGENVIQRTDSRVLGLNLKLFF